jgi:hypothetical protein
VYIVNSPNQTDMQVNEATKPKATRLPFVEEPSPEPEGTEMAKFMKVAEVVPDAGRRKTLAEVLQELAVMPESAELVEPVEGTEIAETRESAGITELMEPTESTKPTVVHNAAAVALEVPDTMLVYTDTEEEVDEDFTYPTFIDDGRKPLLSLHLACRR